MKKIFSISVIFCIALSFAFSQDTLSSKKIFLNFNGHYGFIIAHHSNMDYLIKSHIPAGEFDLLVQTNGEKRWEKIYKNPEKGIGFFAAYLGNPLLGNGFGIFPFINFPLNPGRKFKLYFRSSDGIGLITNPFNPETNHKNNINGSYINAFINLRLNTVFYPAKKIRMETGIGLSHLSNGALAMPNLGINLATINLGISFQKPEARSQKPEAKRTNNKQLTTNNYSLNIIAAAGPNQTMPPGGKEFGGYMLSVCEWRKVSEKSKFGAGFDLLYDFSNIEDAKRDTTFDTTKPLNNLQVGIKLGYELVIGKISLPVEMGYYLFSMTKNGGPLYHRIGIRYYVNKHLIINYTLKTQWSVAENLEFGIGYRF